MRNPPPSHPHPLMPLMAALLVHRRQAHAQRDKLLGGTDEIPADSAWHADNDDSLVEAQLEASADAGKVAVAAHEHEGAYAWAVEDGLDNVHEHVEVDGTLSDDRHRSGKGAPIAIP